MFYYIDGTVTVLEQGLAVIDCGGVGYACHASQNTIGKLKMGTRARLLTYLNVREDIFELYGFIDEEELSCFKMMIGVSGVGPKAALAILSIAPPDRLALSIITGDEKLLMQAPGIGKKIAQRIVLELRDKMSKEQLANIASLMSRIKNLMKFCKKQLANRIRKREKNISLSLIVFSKMKCTQFQPSIRRFLMPIKRILYVIKLTLTIITFMNSTGNNS